MAIDRIAYLTSPLSTGALLFSHLSGYDAVSDCFCFEVTAVSEDIDIVANELLGEIINIAVTTNEENPLMIRHFNGIVDQFAYKGVGEQGFANYKLTLRPQLWLLSKTTDNRIFQNMTAQDIVSQLLDEHGVNDYAWSVKGANTQREYCVQFGETDLDFIQRLLEEEGVFYYFTFEEGKHTLEFSDEPMDAPSVADVRNLRYEANATPATEGIGVITDFSRVDSVVSATHTLQDYNFETPSADLTAQMQNPKGHTHDAMERYTYPGRYRQTSEGDTIATIRNEQDQALAYQIEAASSASMPCSGHAFALYDYPRAVENIDYMILTAIYEIADGEYYSGTSVVERGFSATYELVPKYAGFRPKQITPKPVMKGPQTAIVVGPGGEEIYTDQYSRVKVHFYWDREGGRDENSTCFIRVSSAWAGAGWGFIQIPRIGHEVIVDFLDGDPDRPIITGRVYNAEQMPPYELPGNATQSGWKSDSSKGSGGWNELRFEDLKGSEEVYFQAEKDHNEWIKNNETRNVDNDFAETVGNDATQDVVNNRDETVGNNKTTTVGVNRDVQIGSNDTEKVGANRSLTVGANETISIGANSTETIGANHAQSVMANQTVTVQVARVDTVGAAETRTVGATQINTIGAVRQVSVGAAQSHDIGANDSWEIGANQSTKVGANQTLEVGADRGVNVGGSNATNVGKDMGIAVAEDMEVQVGKNFLTNATDSLTLVCGKASIELKKDGTITIKGKDIKLDASGKIDVKAGGTIKMKGSAIHQN